MIYRVILVSVILAGLLATVAFGALSFQAEPRETCGWDRDFCSEYGAYYGGFALLSFLASGLAYLGLWRMKR